MALIPTWHRVLLIGVVLSSWAVWVLCAERQSAESTRSGEQDQSPNVDEGDAEQRVAITVARDRAKLMHAIYAATLDTMHHHYFDANRAVLPARAMEDVFAEITRQSRIKARWIAVNTKAMSVHHEPRSDFEKKAAAEIVAGKGDYERVEDGYYHRAAAIPLTSGCIRCHSGFFNSPPKTPRYAGLVISVPVTEK